MPIYEFECDNCHHVFEINQKYTDPAPSSCPECKGGPLHKIISHSTFQLKGSGWYSSDYKGDKSSLTSTLPMPGDTDKPLKKSYLDQSAEERKSTIKDITSSVANRL
jgi:putative FmdB family regulatory protein